jgi:hypothetical protein
MDKEINERGESVKGEYDGESLTVEGILLEEEAFWRGTRVLVSWLGFSGSVVEFCSL